MEQVATQQRLQRIPQHARCDYCNAQEGKKRIIGQFIVRLRPVEVFGTQKLACQSCFRKEEKIKASRLADDQKRSGKKKRHFRKLKRIRYKQLVSLSGHSLGFILLLSASALDQAPVDDGPGLLSEESEYYADTWLSFGQRGEPEIDFFGCLPSGY